MQQEEEITVEKNLRESRAHGNYAFPVDIHKDSYPPSKGEGNFGIPCHWHPEVEVLIVKEGILHCQVSLTEYELHPNEAVFINRNQLHSGFAGEEGCQLHSFIFHPGFLYGQESSIIYQKYVRPLLENPKFPSFHLMQEEAVQVQCMSALEKCYYLQKEGKGNWELDILSHMAVFWDGLWNLNCQYSSPVCMGKKAVRDWTNIKELLKFVKEHYREKISLKDMAQALAMSEGECGRLCKRMLHQTPINYLISYRVEQSIPYLVEGELSITEIALQVGFSGSSYYAEMFRRVKGVSPKEFQNSLLTAGARR